MGDMGKYPGLVRRVSVFQYRRRVPEDLRTCIAANKDRWRRLSLSPGSPFEKWRDLLQPNGTVRSEITRSLQTADRREAERRYLNVANEISRGFEAIIARMVEEEPGASDRDLVAIAQSYFVSRERLVDAEFKGLKPDHHQIVANWRDDLATMGSSDPLMLGGFTSLASDLLGRSGFKNSHDAAHILGGYLRRADLMLLSNKVFAWEQDNAVDTTLEQDPLFVPVVGSYAQTTTLPNSVEKNPRRLASIKEVYELYKARKTRSARSSKTVSGYDYVWGLMADFFDVTKPLSQVTRDETSRFEMLLRGLPPNWRKKRELRYLTAPQAAIEATRLKLKPIADNTLYGYLSDLSAFFSWAEKEDYVEKSVAKGLAEKPSGPAQKRRLEFSSDDLSKLFGQHYRDVAQKNQGKKSTAAETDLPNDPRYWVPLIALFTGMRLAEICQLTRRELQTIAGIPCIVTMWDVSDDTDYSAEAEENYVRSMKTDGALRAIPLVDDLHALGFWRFAQRLPEGSSARLFPQLKADAHGYIAAPISRWFARYKAASGIEDRRKVFHSFRHTFRSAMRRAEVSHDVAVKIGGWAGSGMADHYGSDNLVKLAHKQLNRISYPGLDLSHLFVDVKSGQSNADDKSSD